MPNDELSEEEKLTLASYGRIAAQRQQNHSNPETWRAEFEKFSKLLPSGRVIDLGCGAGRDAGLLIGGGYDYVGVDLSEAMLTLAHASHPDADFRLMSLYRLEFPDAHFDGFWAMTSLIHVPKRNIDRVLGEIRRVVRPGGVGFISMWKGEGESVVRGWMDGDSRLFVDYQPGEWAEALVRNGFMVLDSAQRAFRSSTGRDLTLLVDYVRA